MWTPVQGNDADVVNLFGDNGHVTGTLYDLEIAVVAGRKQGRSNVVPSDTTRAQRPVLRAVEFMALFFGRHVGESLFRFHRQGRDSSLLPHYQRGSPVPGNPGLEPVQPELGVIVMHILRGCAWYA